jgi:hypothetical protein
MTQKATALIKFKHCDFGEHYAEAMAAYDLNPQTAWIAPFTIAQRAYWAQQGGGLINGYAEDYATSRSQSIDASAQSAYATCMAGGASLSPAPVVEPGFTLSLQTKLAGGSTSGIVTYAGTGGPSTQVSVSFKPELDHPLDWKAFYRVGVIQIAYKYPENWVMSYPEGGGYPLPEYTELLMRPTVKVAASDLVSLSADLAQYIDAPIGKTLTTPENLSADFTAVQSAFSFTIQRRVVLPDGQIIQEEFEYETGATSGELPDINATVNFPSLDASCNVSGTVDVYHFITAYSFGTLYKLSDKIQQVRVDGVDYDFTVPANAVGSVPPSYGPPGFVSIHESFYYQAVDFSAFGIAMLYVRQDGVIYGRAVSLVWEGQVIPSEALQGYTSNLPWPGVLSYTTTSPLPTALSVTFFKTGEASTTIALDIVESVVATRELVPDDIFPIMKPLFDYLTSAAIKPGLEGFVSEMVVAKPSASAAFNDYQAQYAEMITAYAVAAADAWAAYLALESWVAKDPYYYDSGYSPTNPPPTTYHAYTECMEYLSAYQTSTQSDLVRQTHYTSTRASANTLYSMLTDKPWYRLGVSSTHIRPYNVSSGLLTQQVLIQDVLASNPTDTTNIGGTVVSVGTPPWAFGDTLPDFLVLG